MRRDKRLLVAMGLGAVSASALVAGWFALSAAMVGSAMDDVERQSIAIALGPRAPLFFLVMVAVAGSGAALGQWVYRRWVAPPAHLLEHARILASTDAQRPIVAEGGGAVPELARVINDLAARRTQLEHDMASHVAQASRNIAQERNRLAALMSELTQSVVVCNLDGRILLYNSRARVQFRALSKAPALADGAELIGLGRSIYAVFDRNLVTHALDSVQQRLARGAAHPAAQFVTVTRAGQLLRVQLAPVRSVIAQGEAPQSAADTQSGPEQVQAEAGEQSPRSEDSALPSLAGFVLMLDNITREFEQETVRDRLLHGFTESSRGSLANLQAAVEILEDPALDAPTRERLLGVVRDESRAMSTRIQDLATHAARGLATRWPLEEMRGADLVAAAQRRLESQLQLAVRTGAVDAALWLHLDSFSLLQALSFLAARLRDDYEIKTVELRLTSARTEHAHLDLLWTGQAVSTETVMTWEIDPMRIGNESSPLTIRDVVQRHGGEFWFERERARQAAFFRFLLPQAAERIEVEAATFLRSDSRPEYYDFDLFRATDASRILDERRLVDLTYTVFDTETTGLEPSAGDEIIQIGAVRLVNGKLRRSESFEQLVDPKRPIPLAGIPIHGIRPEMVVGQPAIDTVLPAFHAYAEDTVLVAHNAAFDMRFLQLKESATGVRFDQPVLDTLLLSALVHPNQASHKLEDIAERLSIPVIGRHTALGDAIVTAEVFLRLIPLLADKGIHTLGQAREAAQETYYARLKY